MGEMKYAPLCKYPVFGSSLSKQYTFVASNPKTKAKGNTDDRKCGWQLDKTLEQLLPHLKPIKQRDTQTNNLLKIGKNVAQ